MTFEFICPVCKAVLRKEIHNGNVHHVQKVPELQWTYIPCDPCGVVWSARVPSEMELK